MPSLEALLRHPLPMLPALLAKPWGGRRLATVLGKPLPGDEPVGEAWEVSDRPEGCSRVGAGPLTGTPLDELLARHAGALLGASRQASSCRFPLLFKLLDCRETLSVQVHPDDEGARRHGDLGKEEAWVVIAAEPGAHLFIGLDRPASASEVRAAIAEERLPELLCRVEVSPGEVFHVRPGTVHAIGAGCLLAEIQQASDLTFRLYDWGRRGLDGQPRALHLEDALACSTLGPAAAAVVPAPRPVAGGVLEQLIDGDKFALSRLRLDGAAELPLDGRPLIACALQGDCAIAAHGVRHDLLVGATALVPAAAGRVNLSGRGTVLLAQPPARARA